MTVEIQYHDPATNPTGPHDLRPNADLIARFRRPSVGATDAEAVALVDGLDHEVIRSESDDLLRARVEEFRQDGEVFQPAEHSIADVEEYVGDDVNRAREALAAENGRDKPRTTLVAKLNAIIDDAQVNTPPVVVVGEHANTETGQASTPEGVPTGTADAAGDGQHV